MNGHAAPPKRPLEPPTPPPRPPTRNRGSPRDLELETFCLKTVQMAVGRWMIHTFTNIYPHLDILSGSIPNAPIGFDPGAQPHTHVQIRWAAGIEPPKMSRCRGWCGKLVFFTQGLRSLGARNIHTSVCIRHFNTSHISRLLHPDSVTDPCEGTPQKSGGSVQGNTHSEGARPC